MPALEARLDRMIAARTVPLGISVDTTYAHAAWGAELGGISFPLLSDFHPKGQVAERYGVYLGGAGICDRATILIDASGVVRWTESVTPSGQRDIEALVARCEALAGDWPDPLPPIDAPPGLPADATLYIKDKCAYSRWVCHARTNLHLEERIALRNISRDPTAAAELERIGGKAQVPAYVEEGRVRYESDAIMRYLVERTAPRW